MSRLQIRLFGPYLDSFLPHSYGCEPANESKSVLKLPNFRFAPHSPTGDVRMKATTRNLKAAVPVG